jgi:hypothetical protein
MIFFPNRDHLIRLLKEADPPDRIEQPARNADRPAPLFGRPQLEFGHGPLIELSQLVAHRWQQDWIAQVGDAVGGRCAELPRQAIVNKRMGPVERDRLRSGRRQNEIVADRRVAVGDAGDPSGRGVRHEVRPRCPPQLANSAPRGDDAGEQTL